MTSGKLFQNLAREAEGSENDQDPTLSKSIPSKGAKESKAR
jgi:hypothetical protein